MKKLMVIRAFKEGKKEQVHKILAEIDRETSNYIMRSLSEEHGFPVVEVDGTLVTSMEYVNLLFDVNTVRYLPKKFKKFKLATMRLSDPCALKLSTDIRSALGLHKKASDVLLPGWPEIFIAGIQGRGERSNEIKQYLLGAERYARAEIHTQVTTGKTLREHIQKTVEHPQTHKDIIEAVSDNAITISKDEYIGLLQCKVRLLEKPKSRRKNIPLSNEDIVRIYDLEARGLNRRETADKIGRSSGSVSSVLKFRPLVPLKPFRPLKGEVE